MMAIEPLRSSSKAYGKAQRLSVARHKNIVSFQLTCAGFGRMMEKPNLSTRNDTIKIHREVIVK